MFIVLMVIGGYSIGVYCSLLLNIILVAISGYKPLMVIDDYFINCCCIINYCWLLYVILQLLVIIVL
jgi:hypothetical protein